MGLSRHSNTVPCEWGRGEAAEPWQCPTPVANLSRSNSQIEAESQSIRWAGALFAAVLGLVFGSFLNVVLTRFPQGESIVRPRSHCRRCQHTLAWWENLPVLSWLMLRGRCRQCHHWIGIRYPLVELATGFLWAACWLHSTPPECPVADLSACGLPAAQSTAQITAQSTAQIPAQILAQIPAQILAEAVARAALCWLLLALALLDAESFWLPDWFTWPGIGMGLLGLILERFLMGTTEAALRHMVWMRTLAILAAAGLILLIRLAYWLVRRQEGMGLGDAKLMAMLAAWLGLQGALECFVLAILAATFVALAWLSIRALRRANGAWASLPLPLGTFLCAAALTEIFFPGWLAGALGIDLAALAPSIGL